MSRLKQAPAISIAVGALFVSLGGGAYAAETLAAGSVGTKQLQDHSVTHSKLAANSVWADDLGRGVVHSGNLDRSLKSELARHNQRGPAGPQGPKGTAGHNGQNGANPGEAVIDVPSIASSSGTNSNPDSGDPGDQGFYYTGEGSGGSATITGGELVLTGTGVDSNTWQGGIGIAKAYSSVPLSQLDGVSFDYHIGTTYNTNTPLVHVTVTGLTHDSKYSSGFANLVYAPALNGVTASAGQAYSADAFLPGAKWYSTTESDINSAGGQNDPQPLSYFTSNNPSATIGQISLDNGGSSGATGTFAAAADDLVIGLNGSIVRYDFGG